MSTDVLIPLAGALALALPLGVVLHLIADRAVHRLDRKKSLGSAETGGESSTPPVKIASNAGRWQLLVTILAVSLALGAAVLLQERPFILTAFWSGLFILIAAIDLRTRLILNVLTYPAIAIAIALAALNGVDSFINAVLGGLTAGGIFFLFFALGLLLSSGGTVFGFGDVKMALLVGLVTGFPLALLAVYACVLIGGLTSIVLLILRIRGRKQAIPYGPYIAAGGIVALTAGGSVMHWWLG